MTQPRTKTAKAADAETTFPQALAKLLRQRKLKVPAGLAKAPPHAYGSQDASAVDALSRLPDEALAATAEKVAGYAKRQTARAKQTWDTSPLVAELRRRKLKEPPCPIKVVGAAFSFKKPLADWRDAELVAAATEWSKRGR